MEIQYGKEFVEIQVLPYKLDTSEIITVQRMSNVIPVLLFVVDVTEKDIYFINLNDYIDKKLLPEDPYYYKKQSKTIYIPIENKMSLKTPYFEPLRFYAKRPKFYSLFNKITYQCNELLYLIPDIFVAGDDEVRLTEYDSIISKVKHFINILLTFDVWGKSCLWGLLAHYENRINAILQDEIEPLFPLEHQLIPGNIDEERHLKLAGIKVLWEQMNKLYPVYEEHCREFWLPTWIYVDVYRKIISDKPNGT